ncbi:MAG: CBS domain-containing protein [Armatimonadetes bacterium]|nr:CBS domain-containing protein [Armatimonadota bacterium]
MTINDVMTRNPVLCYPETRLQDVASMMVEHDCGAIPVVNAGTSRQPVGIITDRDIVCRAVARARNPIDMHVRECMTGSVVTVSPDMDLQECLEKMEQCQIRRVLVVDEQGDCCGIVAQADIARVAPKSEIGELVRCVSEQTVGA